MSISEKISDMRKRLADCDFSAKQTVFLKDLLEILEKSNNKISDIREQVNEIDVDLGRVEDEIFDDCLCDCDDCCELDECGCCEESNEDCQCGDCSESCESQHDKEGYMPK